MISPFIATVLEYSTAALGGIALFIGLMKTHLGASIFDSILKNYFDRKILSLKFEQEKEISLLKIENDAKLESIKYNNNKEFEKIKGDINIINHRGLSSNEQEYSAIISVWESFIEAHQNTLATIAILVERPDLNAMSGDELIVFVNSIDTSDSNKKFILNSSDKNSAYGRVLRAIDLADAKRAIFSCREILRKRSIFLPTDIEEKFSSALSDLQMVWAEQHVAFDSPGGLKMEASFKFMGGYGERIRGDVRDAVRKRVLYDIEPMEIPQKHSTKSPK